MGWFWSEKKNEKKEEEKEKSIEIASRFLLNPKLKDVPDTQKKAFLKKKGLSDKDIEEAFKRFNEQKNKKEDEKTTSNTQQQADQQTNIEDKQQTIDDQQNEKSSSIKELMAKSQESGFLSLRNRGIAVLEENIFQGHLVTLILSHNKIQNIPVHVSKPSIYIIGLLKNLRTFQAINCNLTNQQISVELFKLELEDVDFSENMIESIEPMTGLIKCKRLRVRSNRIKELPAKVCDIMLLQIAEMKELQLIDIRDNYLTDLDNVQNSNLTRILVKGNNLDRKAEEASKGGVQGIKQYLKELY